MGSWIDKKIIRKSVVISVPTNTPFKLSDYTKNIAWGEHILKPGITNMEHGYDTYGTEVRIIRVNHDTYYTKIFRKGVFLNNNPNYYHIPYGGIGNTHTLLNEPSLGGITIHIEIKNAVSPMQVLVLLNSEYWIINNIYNGTNYIVSGTLKIPATDNYNSLLQIQLIPTTGQITTLTHANITYWKYYGAEEEIHGTTNIIAYEVE